MTFIEPRGWTMSARCKLEKSLGCCYSWGMEQEKFAAEPKRANFSVREGMEDKELLEAIEVGIRQAEAGQTTPHEEVKVIFQSWFSE